MPITAAQANFPGNERQQMSPEPSALMSQGEFLSNGGQGGIDLITENGHTLQTNNTCYS